MTKRLLSWETNMKIPNLMKDNIMNTSNFENKIDADRARFVKKGLTKIKRIVEDIRFSCGNNNSLDKIIELCKEVETKMEK